MAPVHTNSKMNAASKEVSRSNRSVVRLAWGVPTKQGIRQWRSPPARQPSATVLMLSALKHVLQRQGSNILRRAVAVDRLHSALHLEENLLQAKGAFCMLHVVCTDLRTSLSLSPAHATAATCACCPCVTRCVVGRNCGVAAKPVTKLTKISTPSERAMLLGSGEACRSKHQAHAKEVRSQPT